MKDRVREHCFQRNQKLFYRDKENLNAVTRRYNLVYYVGLFNFLLIVNVTTIKKHGVNGNEISTKMKKKWIRRSQSPIN